MSAPRTKRQFAGAASDPAQRQITSFFNKSSTSSSSSSGHENPSNAALFPAPPASVQANLLSVGMRVRKSVPEGYKTGGKYGSFSLWSDPAGTVAAQTSRDTHSLSAIPDSTAGNEANPKELLPFCGIHKVGGLGAQPGAGFAIPNSTVAAVSLGHAGDDLARVPGLDDVPGLSSSQESAASTDSVDSVSSDVRPVPMRAFLNSADSNRKRRTYDDEGDDTSSGGEIRAQDVSWRSKEEWINGEVSPRSWAPANWPEKSRVLAIPRTRRGPWQPDDPLCTKPLAVLGQENMAVDDFEEASFLDQRCRDEMDIE